VGPSRKAFIRNILKQKNDKDMATEERKIGFRAAVIIAVNAMIGAGVLAMPAVLGRNVGPASIISFFIGIGAVLCIGLSLGRAAEIYPGRGWNYLYPSKWAGHRMGMLASSAYLIGVVIAMGFLVQQHIPRDEDQQREAMIYMIATPVLAIIIGYIVHLM